MIERNAYRQMLRSTTIIGGASVINVLLGLLRMKAAALLLGPAGVGLIGLLQNLVNTASTLSALGFGNVGTRQIAEAVGKGDHDEVAAGRRALFWSAMGLAVLGAATFWSLRSPIATHVLDDPTLANDLGWLAVGVALTVASGSQAALLNGLRRIGDLARVSVGSSLLCTVLGVAALALWGERGIVLFVLAVPIASFAIGHWYVAKLGHIDQPATPVSQLFEKIKILARFGIAFMVSGLVMTLGQLLVRTLVQRELGAEALGQFQAAWTIGMTYASFVLTAMTADFYPRLTAAMPDPVAANRMVNEQSEVALLLSGPIILVMLGLAPWMIELLYSEQFHPATQILRWQILGDVLKVASWPLGIIILAAADGRTFLLTESLAMGVFTVVSWVGLPLLGVEATGIAFLAMYAVYLPVVYVLARSRTGFRWQGQVVRLLSIIVFASVSVMLTSRWSAGGAAILGCGMALVLGVSAVNRLGALSETPRSISALVTRIRRTLTMKQR